MRASSGIAAKTTVSRCARLDVGGAGEGKRHGSNLGAGNHD
ncbi:MAG: hypothetical protein QOI25_3860, partial [Mycobacterium sp.]|nr:hypothetical protein [Mycobacterium sp.]